MLTFPTVSKPPVPLVLTAGGGRNDAERSRSGVRVRFSSMLYAFSNRQTHNNAHTRPHSFLIALLSVPQWSKCTLNLPRGRTSLSAAGDSSCHPNSHTHTAPQLASLSCRPFRTSSQSFTRQLPAVSPPCPSPPACLPPRREALGGRSLDAQQSRSNLVMGKLFRPWRILLECFHKMFQRLEGDRVGEWVGCWVVVVVPGGRGRGELYGVSFVHWVFPVRCPTTALQNPHTVVPLRDVRRGLGHEWVYVPAIDSGEGGTGKAVRSFQELSHMCAGIFSVSPNK